MRMYSDDRELKNSIDADCAQPPTIEEVLNRLGDSTWYARIDIKKALWTIVLKPESRKYTGFLFKGQSYVYNKLFFGYR